MRDFSCLKSLLPIVDAHAHPLFQPIPREYRFTFTLTIARTPLSIHSIEPPTMSTSTSLSNDGTCYSEDSCGAGEGYSSPLTSTSTVTSITSLSLLPKKLFLTDDTVLDSDDTLAVRFEEVEAARQLIEEVRAEKKANRLANKRDQPPIQYNLIKPSYHQPTKMTVPLEPIRAVACTSPGCYNSFNTEKEMKRHKRDEPTHFYCKKCDVDCEDWMALVEHKVQKMAEFIERRPDQRPAGNIKHITCEFCGDDFESLGGRLLHRQQVSNIAFGFMSTAAADCTLASPSRAIYSVSWLPECLRARRQHGRTSRKRRV